MGLHVSQVIFTPKLNFGPGENYWGLGWGGRGGLAGGKMLWRVWRGYKGTTSQKKLIS